MENDFTVRSTFTDMDFEVEIVVLDFGEFPFVSDMRHWVPIVRRCISSARYVSEGLRLSFSMLPSFRIALFSINEEYFIAQRKTVYVSKNGERSSKSFVGSFRIDEMCLESVEDGSVKDSIALYMARYSQCCAEILKLSNERNDLLVSLSKVINI